MYGEDCTSDGCGTTKNTVPIHVETGEYNSTKSWKKPSKISADTKEVDSAIY
jgi:hypothetical protein